MSKYVLTDESIKILGRTLYRIKCLKTIPGIAKDGDLGGFIESENNLSQNDNAWIFGNAQIYGNARIYGSAQISDNAQICGNSHIYGCAQIYGNSCYYNNARVYKN